MTATISPVICPDLGINEPHYLGGDAATVAGCSRKTLERRAAKRRKGHTTTVTLTARYYHGLVCYPVTEIHALHEELHGKAQSDA